MHVNSSLLFSDNVNFQNLTDVTEAAQLAAQLETNGMSFYTGKKCRPTCNISLFKTGKKKTKKEAKRLSVVCRALSFWTFPHRWSGGRDFIQKLLQCGTTVQSAYALGTAVK